MCFEFDARPPALPADLVRPVAGGAKAELLELESADGTRFSTALAGSADGGDVGVVILPDVRGLYRFYIELAERFAEAGRHAIAIDYFGRTAGVGERDEEFDFWPHVTETKPDQIQADIAAAIDALKERTGADSVVTVGFCFGGLQSFLADTNGELDLAGAVGFYAGLNTEERWGIKSPVERTADMRGPILGLFGGADEGIPVERVQELERNLESDGVEHEIKVYEGAPHSFFDRKYEEYADACADAWRRVLGFLQGVEDRVRSAQ
ncbi:MAG TPA: dienelactone hydrolase family protein [Thermoleophilaceae bacterium]|jgi:carboxymethylenebutenolidase